MVAERWKKRGPRLDGLRLLFHSAYVRDVDGDGELEVMAVNPEREDCSELVALASGGKVKHSWAFAGTPPPAPTRIGLYEWVVVSGENGIDDSRFVLRIALHEFRGDRRHRPAEPEAVASGTIRGGGMGTRSRAVERLFRPPAGRPSGRRSCSWQRISSAAWMRSRANGYGNPGYSGAQRIPL